MKEAITILIVTLTSYIIATKALSHQSLQIENIKIINYSNSIPVNPILIVEMSYFLREIHHTHESHLDIKLLINTPLKKEEFTLGKDTLFHHISQNKMRLYLPIFHTFKPNTTLKLSLSVLEGKKTIFSTNIFMLVSNYHQEPIFIVDNLEKIEISKSNPTPTRIYFLSQEPQIATIKSHNNFQETLKSKPSQKIKGLHYFEYIFRNEGNYEITIGKTTISTTVVFDRSPPSFSILTPTNNSIFYRTNNIKIKWTDPSDISGIDFSKSSLTIKSNSKTITNITPLISLNRESMISPYEAITLSLPEGEYEVTLSYSDFDNNIGYATNKFKILPPSEDKEKPSFKRINIENSIKISNNEFIVKKPLTIFIEADEGEYGSGVKNIHYMVDNQLFSEPTTSEVKYIKIDITNKTSTLKIWLEDFAGNLSETNTFILKQN